MCVSVNAEIYCIVVAYYICVYEDSVVHLPSIGINMVHQRVPLFEV